MKRVLCLLAVAVLFFLIVAPAQARHHGHGHFGTSVWIGPGWGWGPSWAWGPGWWGAPAYSYSWEPRTYTDEYPEYSTDPGEQEEEPYYWYFCPDAKNYYPYVKQCSSGWLKVVPPPAPRDSKER